MRSPPTGRRRFRPRSSRSARSRRRRSTSATVRAVEAATMPRISTAQKVGNMIGVAVPVIAFVLAIVLLWHRAVGWLDLAVMAVLYVLTGLGITVGYHRLLTHRAFQTSRPVQYAFAIFGSMSVQGPVLHWVADHRKHHAHTDEEGDPHSPHLAGHGIAGAIKGLC